MTAMDRFAQWPPSTYNDSVYSVSTCDRNRSEYNDSVMVISFFFASELSVTVRISQDDNTHHIRFFVDRITHFLYASEAVNKFLIKLHCIRPTKFSKNFAFTSKKD